MCTAVLAIAVQIRPGEIENVLVVTDQFTKYAQAYSTHNQMARATTKTLFDKFPMGNGIAERFHSTLINMLRTLESKQKVD